MVGMGVPSVPVDEAPDQLPCRQLGPRLHEVMDYDLPPLLHPPHTVGGIPMMDGALVGGLTAPLGIEQGLFQHHLARCRPLDHRLELGLCGSIVVELAGVGKQGVQGFGLRIGGDLLGAGLLVTGGQQGGEVVGDVHLDVALGRQLLDYCGGHPVRVPELDEGLDGHLFLLGGLEGAGDQPLSLPHRGVEPLGLQVEDPPDVVPPGVNLEHAPEGRSVEVHDLVELQRAVEPLHKPEAAAHQQARQVSTLDVGGDDTVGQHPWKHPGVVRQGVEVLVGGDELGQSIDIDVHAVGREPLDNLGPEHLDVGAGLQVHDPRHLGVLGDDAGGLVVGGAQFQAAGGP